MRMPRILGFFLLALSVSACGGNKRSQKDLDDPVRAGANLEPISFRFADQKPSVNGDGTKIVFVSGRDSGDQAAKSKAYKVAWPAGGEPGEPARVSTDDSVGIEKNAWVSPDGAWVLLLSATNARTDLYLQDYDGAKAPVRVTEDEALESLASFSPDGKLVAWISTDKAKKTNVVKLAEIGDGSAATLAAQVVMTEEATPAKQVFWLPAATGYTLAIATTDGHADAASYVQRSFADFAGAQASAVQAWFEGFIPDPMLTPVASGSSVLFSRRILASDSAVFGRIGTEPAESPVLTPVQSEPNWKLLQGDAPMTRYADVPGTQTLGLGKSVDGETNFFLERHYYQCLGAKAYFGTAFVIGSLDPGGARTKILPKLDSNANFVAAADFCELKLDGKLAWVDDKISEMAMPANATKDKFRIVYTSRFSTAFDRDCLLLAGDTEVVALDVAGDTKTFYKVSKNPATLRTEASCQL